MTLAQLLVQPKVLVGVKKDAWASLPAAAAQLDRGHPLHQAVRRAARSGAAPRDLALMRGVRLLDLGGGNGGDDESRSAQAGPGLLLGMPADRADAERISDVTWVAWGLSVPSVNLFLVPALRRACSGFGKEPVRSEVDEIMQSREFATARVASRVAVEDALTPLSYRIYPDTPVDEVQQLMARRGLAAVPVVGKNREVLGVITDGDVVPHVLPRQEGEDGLAGESALAARDVMTRSVLCVGADEPLLDASRSMVARGVGQLPVVREGELIGFLERATVLRAFGGAVAADKPAQGRA